ncbi:DgyrCDS1955 [Dimorphilus gyrociliatus]|uniref:Vacuolar protein sorting-associated protein 52 homolog n=1 Tax=Dimorphilus gyrociliatus TaxID=2664684 RepID=A0A7I8VDX1_9ANNE|nr:DgyrCDS1955 [Dimorphilus gyrociliatus]
MAAPELKNELDLDLGNLDLTSDEYLLDEIDVYIQENLEDPIVKEALEKGLDLRHYSKQVETELLEVENNSIQDYIKESKNIAKLHKQMTNCDSILERMEGMLNGFQTDLSSISSEIQKLQRQSVEMNVKLKNRQSVRGELSQFVDEMVIPKKMIEHILETPVTEREFQENLMELNHKINFVKEQSFKDAKSCLDVKDTLEKLKIKAISKIREFLLSKVYQFKKPLTNYQIPQDALLKFRFFNEFLIANERAVAKEIRDEYIDTMSKIYYSYFKGYSTRIMKLQPILKNRSTIFTLGNRGSVLTSELEASIIVPHAAKTTDQRYSFESLFRSQHYALVDNGCREYLFLSEFFCVSGNSAQDLFNAVMHKTVSMFYKQTESYIMESYDSIAMFLCIHIILRYQVLMHKRSTPALNKYWDSLLHLLWPRFEFILQMNIHSVRECDPARLRNIDERPHYITRRYAEFSAAIVGLNESFPSERVEKLLAGLQAEVENFILRMAAEFPDRREQLVFLINNYDMMLSVILERTTDDSKESETFKQQLAARTHEYIEETLMPHFGGMIMFVKEAEDIVERGGSDGLKQQEARINQIVRGFNTDWKRAIESINSQIMKSFTNFKNGTQILQGTLTQMVQYYVRFHKILGTGMLKALGIHKELLNIHQVMVEVKKHKPVF